MKKQEIEKKLKELEERIKKIGVSAFNADEEIVYRMDSLSKEIKQLMEIKEIVKRNDEGASRKFDELFKRVKAIVKFLGVEWGIEMVDNPYTENCLPKVERLKLFKSGEQLAKFAEDFEKTLDNTFNKEDRPFKDWVIDTHNAISPDKKYSLWISSGRFFFRDSISSGEQLLSVCGFRERSQMWKALKKEVRYRCEDVLKNLK